ncbi:MAG: hypothetical protein ABI977_30255 [Acidobacteriota bacterium]
MDITIIPETTAANEIVWRAATDGKEAIGKTAGEALDGLTTQLNKGRNGLFVLYEQWQPDEFFTAVQQQRLSELMARWRIARDADQSLAVQEQKELEELVEAELLASAKRAERVAREMKK